MNQYSLTIDIKEGENTTGQWKFKKNLYAAVSVCTACWITNLDRVQSAPCIVTKRASGTYVLTHSNTYLYVAAARPYELLQADPD